MSELITAELVLLDADLGNSTSEVIEKLALLVANQGRATDAAALAADAKAREAKTATGVPGGIAIPHCRSAAVTEPTLAMVRLAPPVDFGAKDGEADLVFFDHTGVAVMQESETTRWERERTQVNRVITVNEWRMSRGMSPVAGGDRLFVTNQDTPLDNPVFVTGGAEEPPPPTPTPPANGKVNGKVPEKVNA